MQVTLYTDGIQKESFLDQPINHTKTYIHIVVIVVIGTLLSLFDFMKHYKLMYLIVILDGTELTIHRCQC